MLLGAGMSRPVPGTYIVSKSASKVGGARAMRARRLLGNGCRAVGICMNQHRSLTEGSDSMSWAAIVRPVGGKGAKNEALEED